MCGTHVKPVGVVSYLVPAMYEDYSCFFFQSFSRVMTRPVGRVTGCSKSHGSDRVGSGRVWSGLVGLGRVWSGWVGSGRARSGRLGSGRIRRFITDRVRSPDPTWPANPSFRPGPRISTVVTTGKLIHSYFPWFRSCRFNSRGHPCILP